MLVRLCAPPNQVLRARYWKFASSGWALMASSVAYIVAVSTPLRMVDVTVVVILRFLSLVVELTWTRVRRPGAAGIGRTYPRRPAQYPTSRDRRPVVATHCCG